MVASPPLTDLFQQFTTLHVLIVGDIMVDAYVWGHATRLSPEAPVPVVHVARTENRLGGAVQTALTQVVQKEAGLSADDATAYVKNLRKQRRYLEDVY